MTSDAVPDYYATDPLPTDAGRDEEGRVSFEHCVHAMACERMCQYMAPQDREDLPGLLLTDDRACCMCDLYEERGCE